jgi:hypothetical protein
MILDELACGVRPVITNIPLRLGEVNAYFQKRYPIAYKRRFLDTDSVHISDIVRLLTDEEMATFFCFRGEDVHLASVTNVEWRNGKRPDYSAVKDGGVFYVLDEVHIAFNARKWAETGNEVLYYLSQHRKLGDDVVCITQAISNVDKQFRSVAQDYTYIKNLSKQRLGLFRMPSLFMRSTYAQPATDNSKAMENGTFSLDVSGIASCYDTAKGVGIHGRKGADTKERKSGVHWLWFVIGLPLLLFAIYRYVPNMLSRYLFPGLPSHIGQKAVSVERGGSMVASSSASGVSYDPGKTNAMVTNMETIVCTGYGILPGNNTFVTLSDGRIARSRDGEVQSILKHSVFVFNHEYEIHTMKDSDMNSSYFPGGTVSIPQSGVGNVGSYPLTVGSRVVFVPDSRAARKLLPDNGGTIAERMQPSSERNR